ncbi:hypothetical protein TGMAS_247300 [Toxoplasma gondii MAS]|uniref:Uncharacterized protein n=2 Tax=Toxoplasma gondii TaxID=5811 RepID=A0A086QU26_TOXGO|nr:hypothetical protein TGMAS_247300 [Toxoplasma gondii MAS]PUA90590.1 hypothetical protein TGBR9_247300 [Toxoplasma gondii TgCATBr9]
MESQYPNRAGDPPSSCDGPEKSDAAEASPSATPDPVSGPSELFFVPARTLFSEGPLGGSSGGPEAGTPSPFAFHHGGSWRESAGGLADVPRVGVGIGSVPSPLLPSPQSQQPRAASGHRYHEGIKSSRPTASSLHQASRHSSLLRVRRSDRDKAVASRRRQFMPLEAPPLPQPLTPIVQRLQALLPLPPFATDGESARPLPVHEEALLLTKLLHELVACYPDLLENPSAFLTGPQLEPRLNSANPDPGTTGPGPVLMASLVQSIGEVVPAALDAATYLLDLPGEPGSPLVLEFALSLLQHACGCVAAAVAAQPLPEASVQCWLPLLFSVFRRLRAVIEKAGPVDRLAGPPLVLRLRQIQHEVVYALGNIAADLEGGLIEQGGVSVALETMQDALLQLDSQAPPLDCAPSSSVDPSFLPGTSPALQLRTGGWLLGNLLQLPRAIPAIMDDMLGTRGQTTLGQTSLGQGNLGAGEAPSGVSGLRPGGLEVLHALMRLEVEQQHAALRLPATDDRRASVAEGLWALLLFLEAVLRGPMAPAPDQRPKTAQHTLDLCGAVAEEETAKTLERVAPEIVSLLIRLVFEAFEGAQAYRSRRRAAAMQGGGEPLFPGIESFAFGAQTGSLESHAADRALAGGASRGFGAGPLETSAASDLAGDRGDGVLSDRLARFNENGADILIPALKILALLCSNFRVRTCWADAVVAVGGDAFRDLLASCFKTRRTIHRGVYCAALALVASLAAGPPQQTDYVVPLIRGLAEILHSAEPVDIRREAAVSLLHVGLNHGKKHLNAVVEAEPSVIQGMLDILEQNKYDRACVITALDFVNGVLESVPTGRVEVYRRDGIAKIESAQFLHDRAIDNFISWMVSHYFDDFNEAEGDEEAVERLVAEESVLAAQLSDLSKGAQ